MREFCPGELLDYSEEMSRTELKPERPQKKWLPWSASSDIIDPKPADLLEYLPDHRVLICKQCHYAVRSISLPRHLKEIHGIIRSRRLQYIQFAAQYPDTEETNILPPCSDKQFPVPFLPVEAGWACVSPGCDYLCLSEKRMKTHIAASHYKLGKPEEDFIEAPLQTFFRGSQLKYFTIPSKPGHGHWETLSKRGQINGSNCSTANSSAEHKESVDQLTTNEILTKYYRLDANLCSMNTISEDLLLSHFVSSTAITMFHDNRLELLWKQTIPNLAAQFSFLFHGLCACSAFHLAYLNSAQQSHFMIKGLKHQTEALPQFQHAVANINSSNAEAIFAFAHLLIVSVFASERGSSRTHYFIDRTSENHIPTWLHILRGACAMLREYPELREGSMKWLVAIWLDHDARFSELDNTISSTLLAIIPSPDSRNAWSEPDTEVYIDTASKLAIAFKYVETRENLTFWDILQAWPLKFSDQFMIMVDRKHPGALLILGHYCRLLKRLDSVWFVEGSALRLFQYVLSEIGSYWSRSLIDIEQ